MFEINKIYCTECVAGMKKLPDKFVDLTVTSPPYDNLRTYNGFAWDFDATANELYRITKDGGVVVWVVNDATIDGSETGSSFKQALYFKDIGFNLHDTMIWEKPTFTATGALKTRYAPVFEYMFVLSKGKLKTFNPIRDKPNKRCGEAKHGTIRQASGITVPQSSLGKPIAEFGQRHNVWHISTEQSNKKRVHPAQFPEQIANDHIISWSNPGDLVFDPFLGSGTTAKMAVANGRNFLGFDLSEEYCKIAKERVNRYIIESNMQDRYPIIA